MRSPRAAASAAVVVLVLAACSGGGSLDPDEEADLLEGAQLTLDDLPEGFEEADPDDDEDDDDFEDCLEEVGVDPDALDDASVAEDGPVAFELVEDAGFGSVEAELRSLDDEGAARDIVEALGGSDLQDCILESAEDLAEEEGQEVDDIEIDDIDPGAEGDEAIAVRFSAFAGGFDVTSDLHVVLVGPHLVRLEVVSVGELLDDDVAEEALDAILERLEAG